MKRFFALLAGLLLTVSFAFGAFAEENETDGSVELGEISSNEIRGIDGTFEPQEFQMAVNFDISESYTVTIPAAINLSGSPSSGFSGSAQIEVVPELSGGGKNLIVFLKRQTLANLRLYDVNGGLMTDCPSATDFSRVVFTSDISRNGAPAGKTATVEITGSNELKAFGPAAERGVRVLATSGTTAASNVVNYKVTGLEGLSAGSYSFPQTFEIVVE